MFFRLLLESFLRQRRRKLLAGIAILLGTTAVTAMLALATTIGDRIHQELAVYGANIVITPKADQLAVTLGGVDIKPATGGAYLHEKDIEKLHSIFWANNITGVSPELDLGREGKLFRDGPQPPASVPAVAMFFDYEFGQLKTGAIALHPWWKIEGRIPDDYLKKFGFIEVLAGRRLAKKLNLNIGDSFGYQLEPGMHIQSTDGLSYKVVGLLSSDDQTEDELIVPLISFSYPDGNISRVEVSARTKPEDAFARVDPDTLSPKQREIWYCRPYANSIARQIQDAIPGSTAQQIRKVEQTEGTVLSRISGLMWLVSAAALLASGFAVSAAMATAVLERRAEIGLMRSLGASRGAIALLFYAESGLLALLAGTLGYVLGSVLAAWLGARIFSGDPAGHLLNPTLIPITVGIALLVALAGSTPSIRAALNMDPSTVLRADA